MKQMFSKQKMKGKKKSLLLVSLTAIILSATIMACQKDLNSSIPDASFPDSHNVQFNSAAAKEWYYGIFKKSAEYTGNNLRTAKGKKLPDWSK